MNTEKYLFIPHKYYYLLASKIVSRGNWIFK